MMAKKTEKMKTIEEVLDSLSDKELSTFKLQLEKKIDRVLSGEITIREALGFDRESIETLYAEGFRLYNAGLYAKAEGFLRFVSMVEPLEPRYIFALAASMQKQEKYEEAIPLYAKTAVLLPEAPLPFFYIYECYLQLGLEDWAAISLTEAVTRAEKDPERYPLMLRRAKALFVPLWENVQRAKGVEVREQFRADLKEKGVDIEQLEAKRQVENKG